MKILFILTLMSLSFIASSNEFLENYTIIENNKDTKPESSDIKEKYIVNYEKIKFQTNDKIIIAEAKPEVNLKNVEKNVIISNDKIEEVLIEKNNIEEVDILLDEATNQVSNKKIIKNDDSKAQENYNSLLINKIKDLENRIIKLESLERNKIEEI